MGDFLKQLYQVQVIYLRQDFTQFVTGVLKYTNNHRSVFTGDFNVDVMKHSKMARNYINVFYQYSFVNKIICQLMSRLAMELQPCQSIILGIS